jgi:hypothetical protein
LRLGPFKIRTVGVLAKGLYFRESNG